MVYQEDLRSGEAIALWVGDLENEDSLVTYMDRSFGQDFGFRWDTDAPPQYAFSYIEETAGRRRTSSKPCLPLNVHELLGKFPFPGPWRDAADACERMGLLWAKAAVAFLNIRYRPELAQNAHAPLQFVGNFHWPEGREHWEVSEKLRLHKAPFPRLIRQGSFDDSDWEGIVHLDDWSGFATCAELWPDGYEPARGLEPDGDVRLIVKCPGDGATEPSEEQANAFQQMMESPKALPDAVLAAILAEYHTWRADFYGSQVSSDGGKTWQTGWDLPTQYPPNLMPEISTVDDLRHLIRPSSIYVMATPRHGLTRIGFSFKCRWDEEHGLGVSTHDGKILSVGGAEETFSDFYE